MLGDGLKIGSNSLSRKFNYDGRLRSREMQQMALAIILLTSKLYLSDQRYRIQRHQMRSSEAP